MMSENSMYSGMIPEYLNDMLDEKSRSEFEDVLKKDPLLTAELEEFRRVWKIYKEAIPGSDQPSEPVFERILGEIEADSKSESADFKELAYSPSFATRMAGLFGRFTKSAAIPWSLALVQAAVILLLVVSRVPENTYQTLGESPTDSVNSEHIVLNIVFDDTARETDIRRILLQVDGSIVSGPSNQGRYQISILDGKLDDQTLMELRKSEFIRFIEKAN